MLHFIPNHTVGGINLVRAHPKFLLRSRDEAAGKFDARVELFVFVSVVVLLLSGCTGRASYMGRVFQAQSYLVDSDIDQNSLVFIVHSHLLAIRLVSMHRLHGFRA